MHWTNRVNLTPRFIEETTAILTFANGVLGLKGIHTISEHRAQRYTDEFCDSNNVIPIYPNDSRGTAAATTALLTGKVDALIEKIGTLPV